MYIERYQCVCAWIFVHVWNHIDLSNATSSTTASLSSPSVELPLPYRDSKNNPKLETEILNAKQNLDHL